MISVLLVVFKVDGADRDLYTVHAHRSVTDAHLDRGLPGLTKVGYLPVLIPLNRLVKDLDDAHPAD